MKPTLRMALIVCGLTATTLLIMYLAASEAGREAQRSEAAEIRSQIGLYGSALEGTIDHYRALPDVLALDLELNAALTRVADPARQRELDLKLEAVNGAAATSTLTLLDVNGRAVAASNWRSAESNVGHDYRFRPYFRQLLDGNDGRFYGTGYTTGIPGYFLSKALRDPSGTLIGALVIKIDLRALEIQWAKQVSTILVTDLDGAVLLANRQQWHSRVLRPLTWSPGRVGTDAEERNPLLRPVQVRVQENLGPDGARIRLRDHEMAREYFWQTLVLPREGWIVHVLSDTHDVRATGRVAALAAAGVWLSALFLGLFLQQRLRTARLRRRSREELEELVRQHTAALRTAQDELVQAANLAALGNAESLEHLPQGVSVVDANLRLTAWNRRYVELFRVPPELMRVGQPIETILRHNARRGLMGAGDLEESIRRRIDHLRAARPYVFERERADGTVIEIRGNPLPDGGFVTSFADITAYKSAARDLRTLATTLELRVEQRTQELREAKGDAERANRAKTRIVTAAVHDLQQPLNAARMFAAALDERLHEPATRRLAGHVQESLAAQEAILSGLLDISRLESGVMPTRVVDFALGPLFDALRRDFMIASEAKGLRLRVAKTRAVVRSDESLLRRILQNFLSNAVRYTAHGRILMGVRCCGGRVRIEVWDTGAGIPQQHLREVFEEFRRLDHGSEQAVHGTGLGLAIVERTARLLGHDVGLRSWVGRGSVFSLTLPRGVAAQVTPSASASSAADSVLHGRLIWCVDDDAGVRAGARALLEHWGCRVVTAAGIADGVALARPGDVPDLLLLDYHFGSVDGPAVCTALCQRWGTTPAVVLVTAERDPAVAAMARAQGWGFLHKPLRPPALRALMKQLLVRSDVR